jgi:3,2-trans-enoyl-CoA isomerase
MSCKLKNEMKPVNNVLTGNFFEIEEKPERGYAIFRLNKAPVNSFNLEYLTALNIQLEKFEKSKNINGIIVTSSLPNIFSAGLDLMELYNPREDRLRQFWSSLQGNMFYY